MFELIESLKDLEVGENTVSKIFNTNSIEKLNNLVLNKAFAYPEYKFTGCPINSNQFRVTISK